jgi:hypothetical protein
MSCICNTLSGIDSKPIRFENEMNYALTYYIVVRFLRIVAIILYLLCEICFPLLLLLLLLL